MHKLRRMAHYVYQQKDWPHFYWDNEVLVLKLSEVRNKQGRLLGKMEALGLDLQNEALLKTLSSDVLYSSQIEGENFNSEEVRSSVARKLGMEFAGMVDSNRFVDGVSEVTVDATKNAHLPLTKERLCAWHAALFPTGKSGMFSITVSDYRKDDKGSMQVVSGAMGFERVHFEAPKADKLEAEMHQFLTWFNSDVPLDGVLKAALAHFWFVTVHPFDDGNGRLARAVADMQLAKSEHVNQRFYSMSSQLLKERKAVLSATRVISKRRFRSYFLVGLVFRLFAYNIKFFGRITFQSLVESTFLGKNISKLCSINVRPTCSIN